MVRYHPPRIWERGLSGGRRTLRRPVAELTQEALAELAGVSLRGVSDLERGLRRAPHRDTLQRLLEALQLGPLERDAMQNAARQRGHMITNPESQQSIGTAALRMTLSSFVGWERELAELEPRLASVRLLTLTGPGGSGKTRLALQVASDVAAEFADGVVFAPLAPISDSELVASAVAQALGIRDLGGRSMLQRLNEYLRPSSILLVLDKFEQVLSAAPLVNGILGACQNVRVLVTSREPLRVRGEHQYEVPPLALPIAGAPYPVEALSALWRSGVICRSRDPDQAGPFTDQKQRGRRRRDLSSTGWFAAADRVGSSLHASAAPARVARTARASIDAIDGWTARSAVAARAGQRTSVDRILRPKYPENLPIERPAMFESLAKCTTGALMEVTRASGGDWLRDWMRPDLSASGKCLFIPLPSGM